jgi:hypothetical protein
VIDLLLQQSHQPALLPHLRLIPAPHRPHDIIVRVQQPQGTGKLLVVAPLTCFQDLLETETVSQLVSRWSILCIS